MTQPVGDFRYEGGRFVPAEPLVLERNGDDLEEVLGRAGYQRSQSFGDDLGANFTLYEMDSTHENSGAMPTWVVVFSTHGTWCEIAVGTWPDLIDLLAKLSPIVTAGFIHWTNEQGAYLPVHVIPESKPAGRQR